MLAVCFIVLLTGFYESFYIINLHQLYRFRGSVFTSSGNRNRHVSIGSTANCASDVLTKGALISLHQLKYFLGHPVFYQKASSHIAKTHTLKILGENVTNLLK